VRELFFPVDKMKLSRLLVLGALVIAQASAAHALNCGKASLPVEKLFCATPELKKADEAMSAAYFKLLRETADPDFHEALIRSQRRWLEVRSHGVDRFGAAEGDQTDDRKVLLNLTRDRLTFLQTGAPIRVMEQQRKIAVQDGGGSFAGYETSSCFFPPPPYGSWGYVCPGAAHRQHNDRICSIAMEWASGHMTEYRLVSVLKNSESKPVASCSTGYAGTSERCPEPDDDAETKAVAHWNTNPEPSDELPIPHANRLWKYDPDIDVDPTTTGQPWMHDCLFASTYPPPEVSHPDSASKK
jgi:uncharacterized protein YecT (DUF1311 family)